MTGQYAGTQVADVIRVVVAPTRKFGLVSLQVLDVGRQIASTLAKRILPRPSTIYAGFRRTSSATTWAYDA